MIRKFFKVSFAIALISATIVLQGCSQASESNIAKNGNTNQAVVVSNSTRSNPANNSAVNNNVAPITNSAPPVNQKPVLKVTEPTPKIGSGGDDLGLCTQVRGKLLGDQELTNVIVEIKEGNVTLSGKVSSEAQKKKAEQLAQSVQGIKSIKNNLRVGQ